MARGVTVVETGNQQRHEDARADQTPGLERVQVAQALGVEIFARGHVHVLAADHAAHARRSRELAKRRQHAERGRPSGAGRRGDRLGEQAVTGEDRNVLAVDDVRGGPSAAQLVVVHRRQVVVDQRVRMDELDRGSCRQHLNRVASRRARCGETQDRADPLTAGEQRVAHRLVEPVGCAQVREAQAPPGSPRPGSRRSSG